MAEDELILLYRPVHATSVCLVAVDRDNNVWIGGTSSRSEAVKSHTNGGAVI